MAWMLTKVSDNLAHWLISAQRRTTSQNQPGPRARASRDEPPCAYRPCPASGPWTAARRRQQTGSIAPGRYSRRCPSPRTRPRARAAARRGFATSARLTAWRAWRGLSCHARRARAPVRKSTSESEFTAIPRPLWLNRAVRDRTATPSSRRRVDGVEVMIRRTTATTRGAHPLTQGASRSNYQPYVQSTKGSGYFPTVENRVRRAWRSCISSG